MKQFIIWLCLLFVALIGMSQRYNVLLIMVDDLRPQLGCYGQSQMYTPNIDEIAKNGITFKNAYCQQAVCNPSRASILTGLRPNSTGVTGNNTHFRIAKPNVVTLPQHFKNNGYHTQSIGKIFHTNLDDPMSWSVPSWMLPISRYGKASTITEMATQQAKLDAKGETFKEIQEFDAYGTPLRVKQVGKEAKGPSWEDPEVNDTALRDGKTMAKALSALKEIAVNKKPFFLAVGFSNPHLPFAAPKKYYDLYPPSGIRISQMTNTPIGAPELAVRNGGDLYNYSDIPEKYNVSSDKAKELIRGYYAATTYSDAMIGYIVNELKTLGLYDSTIIVVLGDHGYHLGENGTWSKQTNFDMATKAPFIIAIPKHKNNGIQPTGIVELVDLYPTLCDIAQLPTPKNMEGSSLAKYIENPLLNLKKAAFSQYPRKKDGKAIMGYSIKTKEYRYTEWMTLDDNKVIATELYDHTIDASETVNRSELKEYTTIKKTMAADLKKGWLAYKL